MAHVKGATEAYEANMHKRGSFLKSLIRTSHTFTLVESKGGDIAMGKPSKGTPKDKRLTKNKPKPTKKGK